MEFTKMHGAANDFVMVDARKIKRDWSKLAIAVCDRHRGIGADSLIILLDSDKADFGMRTFDADGSEAETCGNGIRCLARYTLAKGLVKPDMEEMTIETVATVNHVKMERKGNKVVKFRANMGKPMLAAVQIPVVLNPGNDVVDHDGMLSYKVRVNGTDLSLNLVSMGNPHAVHFSGEPVADFPLAKIGPLVENLAVFPNRVNFEVARVLDRNTVEARVWERGVGETLACGSGACAITVASKLLGYTESKVDIKLPGGVLNAAWNGNKEVVLAGPAEVVFEGTWPD
ncbi:MAG: diaminopimelate epimerase [Chloroflexi bacterium RBG_13_57_8]|nr:MAG: diaminopimelate epimerase [Chloroflexi bacterium RBG_13_57_8]